MSNMPKIRRRKPAIVPVVEFEGGPWDGRRIRDFWDKDVLRIHIKGIPTGWVYFRTGLDKFTECQLINDFELDRLCERFQVDNPKKPGDAPA